jgi:catechol 2,3-dioxygenase-like lactoylglutathione lyase family enzyme
MDDDAARRARERRREDLLAGMRLATRLREANPPSPARAEQERRQRRDRIAGLLRQVEEGDPDADYIDQETAALLRAELARLDEVTVGADRPDGDVVRPLITITRRNTILYCRHWRDTVNFYRSDVGFAVLARRDWFVEFALGTDSALSVADASRTTIDPVGGQGITLSWRVADLAATRTRLVDNGLEPTPVRRVWDAVACYLFDPEGHRIELWSDGPEP